MTRASNTLQWVACSTVNRRTSAFTCEFLLGLPFCGLHFTPLPPSLAAVPVEFSEPGQQQKQQQQQEQPPVIIPLRLAILAF